MLPGSPHECPAGYGGYTQPRVLSHALAVQSLPSLHTIGSLIVVVSVALLFAGFVSGAPLETVAVLTVKRTGDRGLPRQ